MCKKCSLCSLTNLIVTNLMICSLIVNVIKPRLRSSVAYAKTASAMWQDLEKRYGVTNAPRRYQLKAHIYR